MHQKGNHKLKPKKLGQFPIGKVINENAYIIDLPLEFQISHTFNVSDITPYYPPDQIPIQLSDHILSEHESSSERGRDAVFAATHPIIL